ARKGAGEDMEAVTAHEGRQPDVGDDEPLGRLGLPALRDRLSGAGTQHVDTGFPLGQGLVDRYRARHLMVELRTDFERSFPQLLAGLSRNLACLVIAE